MAATPSIKIVMEMPYRGETRRVSNRYHFNGGTPTTTASWTALADAVVAAQKTAFTSRATIVEAIGYEAGSDVPVFSKTYSVAGTLVTSGVVPATGDSAALLRYSTTARTAKNHPVYLFNYLHPAIVNGTGGDDLHLPQKAAIEAFADDWLAGFADGDGHTLVRAGPNGTTAVSRFVSPYIHHRDFS